MTAPTGYKVISYGGMINDHLRMAAYAQALKSAVFPGSIVLDIGAGTGIFSILACQLGAAQVYAVEPDESVQIARQIAERNGYGTRIKIVEDLSTNVRLPDPANVVVSDLRGILPLMGQHIPSIIDARQRLLASGGILIPKKDTMWASLVSDESIYRPYAEPWRQNEFGIDMSPGHQLVVNTWQQVHLGRYQLLTAPQKWVELDYSTIDSSNADGEMNWTVEQDGTAHGLVVWFDTELTQSAGFSNAPGNPRLIYGQAFFPFYAPIELVAGEEVSVRLRANLVGKEYVWRWDTRVSNPTNGQELRIDYQHSTVYRQAISPIRLQRNASDYIPTLTTDGQIQRRALNLIDGRASLEEIARTLAAEFPDKFDDWRVALLQVSRLSRRYG